MSDGLNGVMPKLCWRFRAMMNALAILLALVVGIRLIWFMYQMIIKMGFFKDDTE